MGGLFMKIMNFAVNLSSQHEFVSKYSKTETLHIWQNRPQENLDELRTDKKTNADLLELSKAAQNAIKLENTKQKEDFHLSEKDKHKIMLIEKMLYALTGKKIKLDVPAELDIKPNNNGSININIYINQPKTRPNNSEGWGVVYQSSETYQETETLNFAAQGVIQTADGKEIKFETQLQLSRQYMTSTNISFKAGDALKDPLVINFDGIQAILGDNKINFDLDSDGDKELVSFVNSGSGFLAIDKNNNGIIDNGTELFGPATGNGFSELAAYDEDHNNWIDENDSVYKDLRIWTYTENGSILNTLSEKNVGAIYLANIDTPFGYKDPNNQLLGMARATGIFVKEDGTVGTVQQIDLVV